MTIYGVTFSSVQAPVVCWLSLSVKTVVNGS